METPWGKAQTEADTAEGIKWVTTASHGGYYLSKERMAELRQKLPTAPAGIAASDGGGWFEEDCDWCAVPLAWPHLFEADDILAAVITATVWRPALTIPAKLVSWAAEYRKTLEGLWEVGGMGTHGKNWRVSFRQLGSENRREVVMQNSPGRRRYTTAELDELAA